MGRIARTVAGARLGVQHASRVKIPAHHLLPGKDSQIESKDSCSSNQYKVNIEYVLPKQQFVYEHYHSDFVQILVACIIFLNFLVAVINKQLIPEKGTTLFQAFIASEWFFNVVFTIEIIINMYGSFFWLFWQSPWNWFDFIVVDISLMALFMDNLPGISVLRLFRAFRVFRLFKRVGSLKKIIEGVIRSLNAVGSAFIILFMIMGIWSIMGVEFFGKRNLKFSLDSSEQLGIQWDWSRNWDEGWIIEDVALGSQAEQLDIRKGYWLYSVREKVLNNDTQDTIKFILENPTSCPMPCTMQFSHTEINQQFGTFSKSILSMWQILSMDSWASSIGRGCLYKLGLPLSSIYFVTYLIINGIIMVNVVMAILLDAYLESGDQMVQELGLKREFELLSNEPLSPSQMIQVIQETLVKPELQKFSKDELSTLIKTFREFPALGKSLQSGVKKFQLEKMKSIPENFSTTL